MHRSNASHGNNRGPAGFSQRDGEKVLCVNMLAWDRVKVYSGACTFAHVTHEERWRDCQILLQYYARSMHSSYESYATTRVAIGVAATALRSSGYLHVQAVLTSHLQAANPAILPVREPPTFRTAADGESPARTYHGGRILGDDGGGGGAAEDRDECQAGGARSFLPHQPCLPRQRGGVGRRGRERRPRRGPNDRKRRDGRRGSR